MTTANATQAITECVRLPLRLESEKLIKYIELDVIEAEQDIIIGCQSIVRLYSKVFVEHIQQLV